ncbi:hypothetical protein [Terricaulis sp.]|uniref:hypothetical protein n=1 Tax=Terricaulis sp. TaxID=2768686 RepID=UPI00378423A4
MADVLIVCVREDEPQAKALAEMFEAAGFSVGGAPSNDAALRSSGAGLVVWSQASIRSRPFLDAAQRVINANKAVVASLIEPPPPSSIGDSQAFDLSEWNGDPNDPSLDPLFFAIDRMVNSARAEVQTAPARQQQAYAPPPRATPTSAPSYSRRPEPPPPPLPQSFQMRSPPPTPAPRGPDLGSEAEHWRAIRDSRDPADFMDYLARYGAEGAFADVAELRLNQLTAQQTQARAPAAPRPAPAPRVEPPPQRRVEPPQQRRADPPPQRRPDPPPQRRREPAYERSYERAGDHRDAPPSTGGGAMRAFILIAILGGLALAGGLYFGGGLGGNTPSEQAVQDVAAPPPVGEEPGTADDQSAAGGVNVSDAATTAAPQPTAQERRQAELERQRREAQENDGPPPAPVTSWTAPQQASNSGGGPVSLRPGENNGASGSSAVAPIPPAVIQPDVQQASTTTATTTAPPLRTAGGNVLWAARPSASRIADLYPSRALRDNVGGRVELDCTVQASLALACTVSRETPSSLGFGRAALSAASSYRARPELSNGASSVGTRTRIAIQFQAPGE